MLKLLEKIEFKSNENKMRYIADTKIALDQYLSKKSNNLDFLLKKRFNWMNDFIKDSDVGIEVGSGIGFSKDYIKNKNFKISDISSDKHLDLKRVDAQNTGLTSESLDFVIASQFSHKSSLHRFSIPLRQFKDLATILAVVVFPIPLIPVKRYALGILFNLIELIIVCETTSCPIRSSNV